MKEAEPKSTINIDITISHQQLEDMLVTALEGGSNYWYRNAGYDIPEERMGEARKQAGSCFLGYAAPFCGGKLTLEVIHDDVLPRRTSSVSYEDVKGGSGETWEIELEDLVYGCQIMAEKYTRHLMDMVNENHDAETADVFLQCCCFGEVIYG